MFSPPESRGRPIRDGDESIPYHRKRIHHDEEGSRSEAEEMLLFQLNWAKDKHNRLCELFAVFMELDPDNAIKCETVDNTSTVILCDKILSLTTNFQKVNYNRHLRNDVMGKLVEMMKDGMEDDERNTMHIIDFIITYTNRIKRNCMIKDE